MERYVVITLEPGGLKAVSVPENLIQERVRHRSDYVVVDGKIVGDRNTAFREIGFKIDFKREKLEGDEQGQMFSLGGFLDVVRAGDLKDTDGTGYYCTDTEKTDIEIYPSDVENDCLQTEFHYVLWYNK